MELTEQEILQDVLIAEKFLMHMYCQFGLECSTKQLRDLFTAMHTVASNNDFKIFQIMHEKGFYPKTAAASKDIKQAVKMHTEMQDMLNQKLGKN